MNAFGSLVVLAGISLSLAAPALGQNTASEKKQFEATKALAEKGDPQAQYNLATLYRSGRGVNRDLSKASRWNRKAAEQGLARAQLRVAYEYGEGTGVKADHIEAVRWLRRAADQGLAEAQFQLGVCCAHGDGIAENPTQAAKCYQQAADQDFPDAQFALGTCYMEGDGVAKDLSLGISWIRKAAELGFAPAQNGYGMCFAKGKGVTQDYVEAYKWLDLAAAQSGEHNIDAKMNLSMAERAMTPEQISQAQKLAQDFKPRSARDSSAKPATSSSNSVSRVSPDQAKTGFVNVKADDDNSEVFLDGSFVGNSPAKLKLDPGSHVIEVKKPGFKVFRKEIKVPEGSELNLHAVLEPQ